MSTSKKRMRTFLIFCVAIALMSCEKEETNDVDDLTSRWKETDHYLSAGGPIQWYPVASESAEIIEFRSDSVFYSSINTHLNRYTIEPASGGVSTKLKLYQQGKNDTTYWFINSVTQNKLTIGFSGCIEGCGKRFSRLDH